MKRRSYAQYCGLATAMDIIGERWTALIVRDLAVRPRRFTDLLEGMKGLGTSLLSERLRHLEEASLIERVALERSAGGGVAYRLTMEGERVAQALAPLAMWGATRLEGPSADFRPEWLMFVLKTAFRPELAGGVDDCYEFTIDGQRLWVTVADGMIDVTTDEPRPADFRATMSLPTLARIGAGLVDPLEAAAAGAAEYDGDPEAGLRAIRLLGAGVDGTVEVAEATQVAAPPGGGKGAKKTGPTSGR